MQHGTILTLTEIDEVSAQFLLLKEASSEEVFYLYYSWLNVMLDSYGLRNC